MDRKKWRNLYRNTMAFVEKVIGTKSCYKLESSVLYKKHLNLNEPKTLSEKIIFLELRSENDNRAEYTDKYDVRKYVSNKGHEDLLVPLVGGPYVSIREIDFAALPAKFALKATHGSDMNIICDNKKQLDVEAVMLEINTWFKRKYSKCYLEKHYLQIKPRVICEEYLQNADQIIDYKIHCLNGKANFILVCSERNNGLKLNLYSPNWDELDEIVGNHKNNKQILKPAELQEMIVIAEDLAVDFKFVRVDLYLIEGKIYFGELTFTPASGFLSNFSSKFNEEKGRVLKI